MMCIAVCFYATFFKKREEKDIGLKNISTTIVTTHSNDSKGRYWGKEWKDKHQSERGSSGAPWQLNRPKSTGSPIHNKLNFFLS